MDQQPTNTNTPPSLPGSGNIVTSGSLEPPRGRWSTALHLVHTHIVLSASIVGIVVVAAAGTGFVLTRHTHTHIHTNPAPVATGNATPTPTPANSTSGATPQNTSPGSPTQTQTPPPTPKTASGGTTQPTTKSGTTSSGGGDGTGGGGLPSAPASSSSWWSSSTTGSGSLIPANQLNTGGCDYQTDTWSGDAGSVGYTATPLSSSNGNPASFSVRLNAHANNQEVVGYPSVQCLMYEAMPANLNSSFRITPPTSSSGLVYEYAYDIWLTTASAATSFNWDNDLELMIWTYNNGQAPIGYWDTSAHTPTATLPDGSKIYTGGDNSTGTVSVLLPSNMTSGNINIASLVTQLKALGYVNSGYNGILDVEYGIEAPYGGNQTFTVNSVSLMN